MVGKTKNNSLFFIGILLVLTLGFAPYFPEPHLWGKIKWIAGGASGMAILDWFDFILHLSPFILLIYIFFKKLND